MKNTYHRNHWQNVVQGGIRKEARMAAHRCQVFTEGLIHGYADQANRKRTPSRHGSKAHL